MDVYNAECLWVTHRKQKFLSETSTNRALTGQHSDTKPLQPDIFRIQNAGKIAFSQQPFPSAAANLRRECMSYSPLRQHLLFSLRSDPRSGGTSHQGNS